MKMFLRIQYLYIHIKILKSCKSGHSYIVEQFDINQAVSHLKSRFTLLTNQKNQTPMGFLTMVQIKI